jgi:protein tyrosine phosphatase (PTP) superfamily phosphohydrolase (DUF442 family)
MIDRLSRWLLPSILGLCGLTGCQSCRPNPPPPVTQPPPGATIIPYNAQPPAGAVPVYPPVPQTSGQVPAAPVQTSPDIRRYAPAASSNWEPANTKQARFDDTEGVRLQVPDANPAQKLAPVAGDSAGLPVGIPGFARARAQVAAGQKPMLEGLDWLKDNGYRTVFLIRAPGQDDAADRRQVEKRGMRFLSLEATPEALNKAAVAEFTKIVTDTSLQPLFVYDRDGSLAGGFWYLYFRTNDRLTDEQARVQAERLGLKDAQNSDQRPLWLAIQKYLSENLR